MVDLSNTVAGEYGVSPGFTMTVLLYEGDIQKVENIEGPAGFTQPYHITRSLRISDADVRDGNAWVEVFDDEALTYTATRRFARAQEGSFGSERVHRPGRQDRGFQRETVQHVSRYRSGRPAVRQPV